MTQLLQKAFAEAAKLPDAEQVLLASRLLTELAVDDDFDRALSGTPHVLSALGLEALVEFHSGKTEPLECQ